MKTVFAFLFTMFACGLLLTAGENAPEVQLPPPGQPEFKAPAGPPPGQPEFKAPAGPPPGRPDFKAPAGPPPQFSPDKKHRNRGFWRAFSQLSAEEQKKMLELQRNDPEQFRKLMQKKTDEFLEQERRERQQIRDLAEVYHQAATEKEKQAVKEKLKAILDEHFRRMLAEHRRNLEQNKKRLQRLEEDLNRREKEQKAIVETMLNHVLTAPAEKTQPPPVKEK